MPVRITSAKSDIKIHAAGPSALSEGRGRRSRQMHDMLSWARVPKTPDEGTFWDKEVPQNQGVRPCGQRKGKTSQPLLSLQLLCPFCHQEAWAFRISRSWKIHVVPRNEASTSIFFSKFLLSLRQQYSLLSFLPKEPCLFLVKPTSAQNTCRGWEVGMHMAR